MSQLRLWTMVGLMIAAMTPLYGCGSQCVDGTTDRDGECVVAVKGCAQGTRLQDGACQLDTTGCGEGTMFSEGACVPASQTCSPDTTFDATTHTCVPNSEIVCGERTRVGDDGYCVPGAEACSDKTVLSEGRCVITAAACGEGTALDPNTGECVLAEEGCSEGLAFDAASGTCVATEDVCDAGTRFDADSGLCLADHCSDGDIVSEGVCISPAEALAADPDLSETENNDPVLGGTAERLSVDAEPFVFVGAIGAPGDLNGDGRIDQDVDVFEFEANAGEWFELAVLSIGLQGPAFVVEGPGGYLRHSPAGRSEDAVREIVVPTDGTYTVTVLPSLVLHSGGEVNFIGGADWTYVGRLQVISPPAGEEVSMASSDGRLRRGGRLIGDYADLRDNLFDLVGLQDGDIVTLEFDTSGADAEAIVEVRDAAGTLIESGTAGDRSRLEFTAVGTTASVLLDWAEIRGPNTAFEIDAAVIGAERISTMAPGTSESFQVIAETEDQILAAQSNPQWAELDVEIVENATSDQLARDHTLGSGQALQPMVSTPGAYTVTFTNTGECNVDATMTAKVFSPFRFGRLGPGASAKTGAFEKKNQTTSYVMFSVGPGQMIEVYHDNDQGDAHSFRLVDDQGVEVESNASFAAYSSDDPDFMYHYAVHGGSFRLEVDGLENVTDEVISIDTITPQAVSLASGGSVERRTGGVLRESRRQWYLVDVGEEAPLQITGASDNGRDIDLFVHNLDMDELLGVTAAGGISDSSTAPVDRYLMAIEPDADIDSFDVTFHLLVPPAPPAFLSAPGLPIPDGDPGGVSDTLTVTGCTTIIDVSVYLDIRHTYRNDLDVDLTSPAGTTVRIWEDTGGDSNDVIGWLPLQWAPANSLTVFNAESGDGDWTIQVYDDSHGDTGTLEEWGLTLSCQGP